MDNPQDHTKKNHAPPAHGSHGGFVCHKCGWPFPNPHPSAKHRRGHRKICGTIDGYKFVDSEETSLLPVSDSDEDPKTPSPKVLDRSKTEEESSASGLKSARSEDDMFSDAIAEFPDSGSSRRIEELMGNVKESPSNVETVEAADRSVEDRAINVMVMPPSDPADSCSLVKDADSPASNLPDSATDPQHHISSENTGLMARSENSYEVPEDKVASAFDPVQLDSQTDASLENVKNNASNPVIEIVDKGNASIDRDEAGKTTVAVSEVVKTDNLSSAPVPSTGVVQMEVEITNEESVDNFSSAPVPSTGFVQMEVEITNEESVERTNTTLQSDHIKTFVDSGAAMDSVNPRSSIEGNDGKEDENMHTFSVPDTAAVGDAEAMIRGFKDHEGGKFPQFVDVESFDVINDVKYSVPEDNPSIFNSIPLNTGTEFCVEDDLELKSGSNQIAKQLPVEGETNVLRVNITANENHRSEGLETLTTGAVETENSHSTQTSSVGHDTKALPDVNPIVFPADAEAIQATKSAGKDDNGGYEKTKAERCDKVGNDNNKDNAKVSCTENIIAISEPATVLKELNVTESINLIGDKNGTDVEVNKIEQSKESGIETGEHVSASVSAEDLSGMSKTSPESTGDLLVAQGNAISASEVRLPEPECTNFGSISDTQDCVKVMDMVQVEHVGVVTATTEADNGGEIEVLKKSTDDQLMKEPPTSPLETSSSVGNTTIDGDSHARDFTTIASGPRSESLTNEGDSNLLVQHHDASATDFSTDSISQTESLEGHWGSVSVLSTVSDILAINDTEPLPSNGSQASVEAEKESSNPKAAFEKQHSDKSDVFEAPSFMTLVEPTSTGGGDQKAAASEIQSQQGLQQPNPAPLQAGWFPSITHVVNESPGRKKNEELIAKVTSWSAGKHSSPLKSQPHTPLKNLLGEANADAKSKSKSPNSKENPQVQKDETTAKGDSALTATVNSILGPEAPEPTKKEGKEWNSPARYPTDIKRERKVKRPYWAQFMCCSSVN